MTLDQFFKALSKVDRRGWQVDKWGGIRWLEGCFEMCPISALCGRDTENFEVVAGELGLSGTDTNSIVAAADRAIDHDAVIRHRILEALGLQEAP